MKRIVRWSMVLAVVLSCPLTWAGGDSSPQKTQDIRKLLTLTGAGEMGKQVMEQMIQAMKGAGTEASEKFWEDFKKDADVDGLISLIVPIYDKHLSHADIKGLIAFYQTPLGRKFVAAQPLIVGESMTAGQQWGMALGQKIAEKLAAENAGK